MQLDHILHMLKDRLPDPDFAGGPDMLASCPSDGGTYLLLLSLDHNQMLHRPKAIAITAGLYGYAGSAYGPGGLKARLARHVKRDKSVRWHIDQLSIKASDHFALGWCGGKECAIIRALETRQGVNHPIPGFGSSDCKCCTSHLLRFET